MFNKISKLYVQTFMVSKTSQMFQMSMGRIFYGSMGYIMAKMGKPNLSAEWMAVMEENDGVVKEFFQELRDNNAGIVEYFKAMEKFAQLMTDRHEERVARFTVARFTDAIELDNN